MSDTLFNKFIRGHITREQYEYFIRKKAKGEFPVGQIGQRIIMLKNFGRGRVGDTGIIKDANGANAFGVEFDRNVDGHDLRGRCEEGHGWYYQREHIGKYLEILDDDVEEGVRNE